MQDRVPTYPGRVTLTQVSGNTYDMVRADQPTQEGTPLNKSNLFDATNETRYGIGTINEAFKMLTKEWTVAVPTTAWSTTATNGFYTATITVSGMKSSYNPLFSLIVTNADLCSDEENAFGLVKGMTTANNSVTFKAIDKPETSINVKVRGV